METPTVVAVVPDRETVGELKVQVTEVDVQESVTTPLKPFVGRSETLMLPGCAALTVRVVAVEENVKFGDPAAGCATPMEPKRPSASLLIPAAKYKVLESPTVPPCPKNISHRPGFAIAVPAAVLNEPA